MRTHAASCSENSAPHSANIRPAEQQSRKAELKNNEESDRERMGRRVRQREGTGTSWGCSSMLDKGGVGESAALEAILH